LPWIVPAKALVPGTGTKRVGSFPRTSQGNGRGVKSSSSIVYETCRKEYRKRGWKSERLQYSPRRPERKGLGTRKGTCIYVLWVHSVVYDFFVVCTDASVVPDHLLGVWKTSEPKFAGCRIEFRQEVLILGLKSGEEEYHAIKKVESVEERDRPVRHTIPCPSINCLFSEGRIEINNMRVKAPDS